MDLIPPMKLSTVNSLINAKLIGNPDYELKGINEIHMVREDDLTFVDHPKYYKKALESAATVIIINKEVEAPKGKHLFISEDPFRDYNFLTKYSFHIISGEILRSLLVPPLPARSFY